jgi:hypothetical protein
VYCAKCAPLYEHTSSALLNVALPGGTPLGEQTTVVGLPSLAEKEVTKFYFCEKCGKRLTDAQIEQGLGRDKKLKGVYCKDCAVGVMTIEFLAIKAPEPAPITAPQVKDRKAAPGSNSKSALSDKSSDRSIQADDGKPVPVKRSISTAAMIGGIGAIALAVVLAVIFASSKRGNASTQSRKPVHSDTVTDKTISSADEHTGAQSAPPEISDEPSQNTSADLESVRAELKRLNPGFDGTLITEVKEGHVLSVRCTSNSLINISPLGRLTDLKTLQLNSTKPTKLNDLAPLRHLKNLTNLSLTNHDVTDLSPLRDLSRLDFLALSNLPASNLEPIHAIKIYSLHIACMPVENISCLKGMSLTDLTMRLLPISDIGPLEGMRLTQLNIADTKVADISVLKGMPITKLVLARTKVEDLTPLLGMPLTDLVIEGSAVKDLRPILGIRTLSAINFGDNPVSDYSPLKALPLVSVDVVVKPGMDLAFLRSIPTLKTINKLTTEQFFAQLSSQSKK